MSAMPPSIAIATPVLGGPGTMRVVLSSSNSRRPLAAARGGDGTAARARTRTRRRGRSRS